MPPAARLLPGCTRQGSAWRAVDRCCEMPGRAIKAVDRGMRTRPQGAPQAVEFRGGFGLRTNCFRVARRNMNKPYGLEIVDNCINCKLKREECFCNLSAPVLKAFSAISHQTIYPPGATLFVEEQLPRGVFLLCSGKVKLSTSSREGRVI